MVTIKLNSSKLTELFANTEGADEHEYLIAIIEAIEDIGAEDKIIKSLQDNGWGSN